MQASSQVLDLLKSIETLQLKPMMPTPNDKPTIGYGCTTYSNGQAVKLTDPAITQELAESLFIDRLYNYIKCVNETIRRDLNQQQFDAFLMMCFNCGVSAFKQSQVAKWFNLGDLNEVKSWWCKSFITQQGKVLNGLINRRKAEWQVFENGIYKRW